MKRTYTTLSTILFAGLLAALPLTGCTDDPQEPTEDELAGETSEDGEALGKADGADNTFTFYKLRPDYRRCVFPLCGGYYVSRVNRAYTRCADGTWARECYVAEIDWPGLSMPEDQTAEVRAEANSGKLLLRGSMATRDYEGFEDMGALRATEAWMGGSDNEPGGLVTKVTDSGIRCITFPCYNTLHEAKINSWRWTSLSEIYLEDTGVSAEEIDGAMAQVFSDDGLIVAGYRYYWWDGGLQKGRYITQFWERIQPRAEQKDCVVGGCSSQVCSDPEFGPVITTCEWRPEYACFRSASCERQSDGDCGWTMDEELTECLDNPLGE